MRRLLEEALRMSGGFEAQHAANSIWAAATLGVDDPHVISSLSGACVTRVRDFNLQAATNALWSAAVLNITDTAITYPLASAVSERFETVTRVDDAQQCLQWTCHNRSCDWDAFLWWLGKIDQGIYRVWWTYTLSTASDGIKRSSCTDRWKDSTLQCPFETKWWVLNVDHNSVLWMGWGGGEGEEGGRRVFEEKVERRDEDNYNVN